MAWLAAFLGEAGSALGTVGTTLGEAAGTVGSALGETAGTVGSTLGSLGGELGAGGMGPATPPTGFLGGMAQAAGGMPATPGVGSMIGQGAGALLQAQQSPMGAAINFGGPALGMSPQQTAFARQLMGQLGGGGGHRMPISQAPAQYGPVTRVMQNIPSNPNSQMAPGILSNGILSGLLSGRR